MRRLDSLNQTHVRPKAEGARVARYAELARRGAEPVTDPKVMAMARAKAAAADGPPERRRGLARPRA
jgi:hypothetical protein